MKGSNNIILFGLFIIYILVFALACSSRTPEIENSDLTEKTNGEDSMLNQGLLKLSDWLQHWESQGSNFNTEGFKLEQSLTFDPLERPEINPVLHNHPLGKYQLQQPSGEGTVDIYDYKIQINANGNVEFNADSEAIYYKDNGMRERLLFLGPSGYFEDAAWISTEYLIIAGFIDNEEGISPVIWLVAVNDSKYHTYGNDFFIPSYEKDSYLKLKLKDLNFAQ